MWVMLFKMSPQDILMWMMILRAVWPVFLMLSYWVTRNVVNYFRVTKSVSPLSKSIKTTRNHKKHMLRLKYKSSHPRKLRHVVGPQRDATVRKYLHVPWQKRKALEKARMKFQAWKRFPSVIIQICQYKLVKLTTVVKETALQCFKRWSFGHGNKKEDYDKMPGMKPCCGHSIPTSYDFCHKKGAHRGQVFACHRDHATNMITMKPIWFITMILLVLLLLGTQTSTMDAENGKSIMGKLPVFTGRKDAFVMWMAKFLAIATMGYYVEAVSYNETTKIWGEPDCPKTKAEADALNSGVPAEKLKIDMWKRNSKAFVNGYCGTVCCSR
jgi:hypothetical protein